MSLHANNVTTRVSLENANEICRNPHIKDADKVLAVLFPTPTDSELLAVHESIVATARLLNASPSNWNNRAILRLMEAHREACQ
jgi:hypothetical protein